MKHCGPGDGTRESTDRCTWCTALQVLGLKSGSSDDDIRSAYRLLAQVWHPDRFQTNPKLKQAAEEKLKEINRAYQFLTSPQGRGARCDGPAPWVGREPATAGSPPYSNPQSGGPERHRPGAISRWARVRLILHSAKLLTYSLVLVSVAGAGALVLHSLDSYLDSNPATSRFYEQTKARVAEEAAVSMASLRTTIRRHLRLSPSGRAPTPANGYENRVKSEPPRNQVTHGARPSPPKVVTIRPYITAGLTQQEVEEV